MPARKSADIHIYLTPEDLERVRAAAAAEGLTYSELFLERVLDRPAADPDVRVPGRGRRRIRYALLLNDDEHRNLMDSAHEAGMTGAAYVRSRCCHGAPVMGDDRESLSGLTNQLSRLGNNLNQIARRLNKTRARDLASTAAEVAPAAFAVYSEIEEAMRQIQLVLRLRV